MKIGVRQEVGRRPSCCRIRQFRASDAAALADVFASAVHGIACRFYSPAQISAWCPETPSSESFLRKLSDGRAVWVAADDADVPVAFIDLEADGHIDMLFCHPRAAGQGVAGMLYGKLEEAALRQGIRLLYVEASEAARSFFERMGFALDKRCEFERGGVKIHNYRMVKILG
ncbi:GNAT family N-acetyltransferase [Leisingera aquimarina]|uniref:GNAT family N-acetyltransferase n=1 Tax=Leisingera aquimarina TaxID=476529 RepID=UPI00068563E2|nr:GNAT family N-acetyltransferase [Leisingera aquimarina]